MKREFLKTFTYRKIRVKEISVGFTWIPENLPLSAAEDFLNLTGERPQGEEIVDISFEEMEGTESEQN